MTASQGLPISLVLQGVGSMMLVDEGRGEEGLERGARVGDRVRKHGLCQISVDETLFLLFLSFASPVVRPFSREDLLRRCSFARMQLLDRKRIID